MPDHPEPIPRPASGPQLHAPEGVDGDAPTRSADPVGLILDRSARDLERELEDRDRRIRALGARVAERDRRGETLADRLVDRGLYATWLASEVDRREERIGELLGRLDSSAAETARIAAELEAMRASRAWQLVDRLSRSARRARRVMSQTLWKSIRAITPGREVRGESVLPISAVAASEAQPQPEPQLDSTPIPEPLREPTIEPISTESQDRDPNAILRFIPPRSDPYDEWLRNNAWDASRMAEAGRLLAGLRRRPTVSVVVAMRGVEPWKIRETLASLREQVYPDREVILVGGSEASSATIGGGKVLVEADEGDAFEALRAAVGRASGDYVVVLEGGARLAPDALLDVARESVEAVESPDLIFWDEDRVDRDGRRFGPRFRPGWSPESLLSYPAIGRTFAVRRSAMAQVGGIRSEFEEAWPYDLALRLAESGGPVVRVPKILVHVPADREGPDPVDRCPTRTIVRMSEALGEAIRRRGIGAAVSRPDWASRERFPAFELDFPDRGPKTAILIPTRDRVDLLRRCIDSILDRTTYRDFEIVVIDNGSEARETLDYLDRLGPACRVVRIENDADGFNYARIHNAAIESLDDRFEFLVFLNNDTEVRRPEWLSQLVGFGGMPGVGAVGARLLYGDGRVQHAGILTDLYDGNSGHAFRLAPWWDGGDQRLALVARNLGAVTAACMLVRRSTYRDLGGFDEKRFGIGHNDVDFCLRLGREGLRCVYAPRAELFHFEGASRGLEDDRREASAYRAAWARHVDPYHHPALAGRDERLGIRTRRLGPVDAARDRPLRVLLDVDRLDAAGNARLLRDLAVRLRERARVVPSIRSSSDGAIGEALRDAGFRVIIDADAGDGGPIDRARGLADRLGSGEFDLIHAVGLDRFETIHAARLAGVPTLWTIRETTDFREAFGSLDDDEARAAIEAFSDAYRVTFPAWGVRRPYHPVEARWNYEVIAEDAPEVGGLPGREQARIALGIDPAARVLACVQDTRDDGSRDFLRAVEPLLLSDRQAVALISAPEEMARLCSIEETVRAMADRIRILPESVDPIEWLSAADLLVCPSRRDLSPRVIGSGIALRLPMVLGEVEGIEEFIQPGREALVFEPGDEAMLRSRIGQFLGDPGMTARLSGAVARVEGPSGMAAAFERLYLEAIAVKEGRGVQGSPAHQGAA